MSRGRPHHQASRRRAYSRRQRELRERQLRAAHDEAAAWPRESLVAIEVDDMSDAEGGGTPWSLPARLPAT